nr:CopD family protein [uncultured Rhodopila sp.]
MTTLYAGLKALHLLCAVLWVGGLFFAFVVLRPSLVAIEPPQRMLLQTRVHRRFFLVIWHAMPLILITGFVMLWQLGGMGSVRWPVHAMLALGLLMAAVFLAIIFGPYRKFRRTTDRTRMAASMSTMRTLIAVNLILGLITVVIAGLL